jgi:hypothetical protein
LTGKGEVINNKPDLSFLNECHRKHEKKAVLPKGNSSSPVAESEREKHSQKPCIVKSKKKQV